MRRPFLLLAWVAATSLALATLAHMASANQSSKQRVEVTLKEFTIGLPRKLKPGETTFVIRNKGHYPHNLVAIWGPVRFASRLTVPGQTTTLTAALVPGAYVVACTVLDGGHIARGMLVVFTIGSRSPGSAIWHYP